jgi:peptidoglycan/xylan/chitin deacetylase (PgdA/CDA1 family)
MSEWATDVERTDSRGAPSGAAPVARWLRVPLRLLSPGGTFGRLSIVIFHRVHARPDPLFPNEMHASAFLDRMHWLKGWFNVLPLDEAVAALARRSLPDRALAITFDDGYADNATIALPILRRLDLHATFFISTGFLDGGRMWNDTVIEAVRAHRDAELDLSALGLGVHVVSSAESRRSTIATLLKYLKYRPFAERESLVESVAKACDADLVPSPMMTSDQLRELTASGMGIGAHTVKHPILANLSEAAARREIADGRDALEGLVGQPVKLFAYPNGKPNVDYRVAHVDMVRRLGFTAAASTACGAARDAHSLFELPRFTPWDRTPRRYGARLARNLLVPGVQASA